jgi:dipeptidase
MWIAPRYPCLQPFVPWYYGITTISPEYEKAPYTDALANYNNKNRNYFDLYPDHACWVFDDFANRVDSCYANDIESIQGWKSRFQMDVFEAVKTHENTIAGLYKSDQAGALRALTGLTNGFAERALHETTGRLRVMKSRTR